MTNRPDLGPRGQGPGGHMSLLISIMSHQITSELRWPRFGENRFALVFSAQAWWAKFALAVLGVRGGSTE